MGKRTKRELGRSCAKLISKNYKTKQTLRINVLLFQNQKPDPSLKLWMEATNKEGQILTTLTRPSHQHKVQYKVPYKKLRNNMF